VSPAAPSARAATRPSPPTASDEGRRRRSDGPGTHVRQTHDPTWSGIVRYLVVLDTALPVGPVMYRFRSLADAASRAGQWPRFDVVVPTVRLTADHRRSARTAARAGVDDDTIDEVAAQRRRDHLVDEFGASGLRLGQVAIGPGDTVSEAVGAVDRHGRTDAVVVLTEPLGMERWLRLDAPNRIARQTGRNVITIEVDPTVV
jgi:hypothetical protein